MRVESSILWWSLQCLHIQRPPSKMASIILTIDCCPLIIIIIAEGEITEHTKGGSPNVMIISKHIATGGKD